MIGETMNLKRIVIDFLTIFVVVLIVTAIVTFLYSLIIHGSGEVDWGTAFQFGIIFGIVLTWINKKK